MIDSAAKENQPFTLCFFDRDIPGFDIEKIKKASDSSEIIVLTSESQIPEPYKSRKNLIFMRRPLKLSWLPDLINEALMKSCRI